MVALRHSFLVPVLIAACAAPTPELRAPDALTAAGADVDDLEILSAAGPLTLAGVPSKLDAERAVALALRNSARLRADLARLRAAAAEAAQTRRWPNPLLTMSLRLPESGGPLAWDLGLSAALVTLLNRPERQSAADARVEAAAAVALATAFAEAESARVAYARAALGAEVEELLAHQESLTAAALARVEARGGVGEAGSEEIARARIARITAESARRTAAVETRAAHLALATLFGEPERTAPYLLTAAPVPEVGASASPWLAAARTSCATVLHARALARAAASDAALAGAVVREGAEVGLVAERDPDWSVGPALALPLPLFDDGSDRRARALAQSAAADLDASAAERDAIAAAHAAWEACSAASQARAHWESTVLPALHTAYERAQAAATAGEAGPEEVARADIALTAARLERLRAELDLHIAYARLLRAAGGTLPAALLSE